MRERTDRAKVMDDEGKLGEVKKLSHNRLKKIAISYLLDKREFKKDNVKEELEFIVGNKKYIIDVVGLDKNKDVLVAIECGNEDYSKMGALTGLVPQVIHIPFYCEFFPYKEAISEIVSLKGENRYLLKEIERQQKVINTQEELIIEQVVMLSKVGETLGEDIFQKERKIIYTTEKQMEKC